jgi:hypothetical protein
MLTQTYSVATCVEAGCELSQAFTYTCADTGNKLVWRLRTDGHFQFGYSGIKWVQNVDHFVLLWVMNEHKYDLRAGPMEF